MGHWWVWYGFRLTAEDISNLIWESLPGCQALKTKERYGDLRLDQSWKELHFLQAWNFDKPPMHWLNFGMSTASQHCSPVMPLLNCYSENVHFPNPKPLRLYWSRSGRPVIVILGKAWKGKSSLRFGLQDFLRQNAESDTPSETPPCHSLNIPRKSY